MKNTGSKVAIIGAGSVGATFAFSLMRSGLAREIVLIDKDEKRAEGECMDLNHGAAFVPPVRIYPAGYKGCKGADIVVITAGAKHNRRTRGYRVGSMEPYQYWRDEAKLVELKVIKPVGEGRALRYILA